VDVDATNSNCGRTPVEAVIVEQVKAPGYLKLANTAKHLRELGI
jgi:hypothetical protein